MRIKIVQEGVEDRAGRTFEHGSLQSGERQIAVLMGGHHDAIIGFASDFQVDEDGWISYDITFRADFLEKFVRTNDKVTDWFDFSGFANNLRQLTSGRKMRITFGEIKAIYAIPKPFPATLTRETHMNDDKNTHTDRHDGGPEARAQRAIDREVANIDSPNKLRAAMGLGAVTESKDYVKLAREEVAKYINRKAEITDGFKVDISYLYVVWFSKTLQNWKALISTSLPDGMYYEATFDGEKNKLYIDAYKKFDNESVDL